MLPVAHMLHLHRLNYPSKLLEWLREYQSGRGKEETQGQSDGGGIIKERESEKEEEEYPAYLEGDAVKIFFDLFIRWISNECETIKEEKKTTEAILATPCLILSQLLQHAQENGYALFFLFAIIFFQ